MALEVRDNKSVINTKRISAYDSNNNEIEIVTLYGAVELNGTTAFNFTIVNEVLFSKNKDAIMEEVVAFKEELNNKVKELGGIVIWRKNYLI